MKLSYSTPSTMYTVTSAARISRGSLVSEFLKAAAVPWKSDCKLVGKCDLACDLVDGGDRIAQCRVLAPG